jgi:hypothetical protein
MDSAGVGDATGPRRGCSRAARALGSWSGFVRRVGREHSGLLIETGAPGRTRTLALSGCELTRCEPRCASLLLRSMPSAASARVLASFTRRQRKRRRPCVRSPVPRRRTRSDVNRTSSDAVVTPKIACDACTSGATTPVRPQALSSAWPGPGGRARSCSRCLAPRSGVESRRRKECARPTGAQRSATDRGTEKRDRPGRREARPTGAQRSRRARQARSDAGAPPTASARPDPGTARVPPGSPGRRRSAPRARARRRAPRAR